MLQRTCTCMSNKCGRDQGYGTVKPAACATSLLQKQANCAVLYTYSLTYVHVSWVRVYCTFGIRSESPGKNIFTTPKYLPFIIRE